MLTPLPGGKMPYEAAFEALKINKPNGLAGEVTGAQPVVRTEPGNPNQQQAPLTIERVNEVRNIYGLAPVNAQGQAGPAGWNPVPPQFWSDPNGNGNR
jgi:hypothetical protein